MADLKPKLIRCFLGVFPNLSETDVLQARSSNVAGWDSVASVTLFATVEEEFGLEIDVQDMKDLLSFENLLRYLEKKIPGSVN